MAEHDSLRARGRAMEDAFFAERDRELLQALRRNAMTKAAEESLRNYTGVSDTIALTELMGAECLVTVVLYPLVAIAWCEKAMSQGKRAAVLNLVREMGVADDAPSRKLLNQWLDHPPVENAMQIWTDYVRALCKALNPQVAQQLKAGILSRARTVAMATGGFLGVGNKISAQEEECLKQLAQAFEIPEAE